MVINLAETRLKLAGRLRIFIRSLQPALRDDVTRALSEKGKLLHQPADLLTGRWALLPFYMAVELNPAVNQNHATDIALAVECLICATDLFDDGMDGDDTLLVTDLGLARTLNVALTLLSLAQHILLSLAKQDIPAAKLTCLQVAMQRALLHATAGQHQDLLAEERLAGDLTREDCLNIAAAKAGTLLSLGCQLGAICAEVDKVQIERCAQMGNLLGIAAQLDNDAHDLHHLLLPLSHLATVEKRKSDLARAKKTLPVVLAAHSLQTMSKLDGTSIDSAFRRFAALTGEKREACICALREGVLATWGISLLYRERARDCLHEIKGGESISLALCQILGFTETPAEVEER
jgi:geranylgeranyl pyrophosphate synthase